MGCADPLEGPRRPRRGVGAPHRYPLESVASYLCHFMLTCGFHIPMAHRNDGRKRCLSSLW